MEIVITLIGCLIAILLVYYAFEINIKRIKELTKNEKIKELTDRFPDDEQICKEMLNMLNNNKVKIKQSENEKDKTSVYIAITDTIIIGNIKGVHTRIQTIAHECLHSVQSRRLLVFNFIFTNIYNIYFILSIVFTIFKIFNNTNLQIVILLFMGIIFYIVRAYLENDAMIKAKYLAEKYMDEYIKENKICNISEIEKVINNYEEINKVGIPAYNFILLLKPMIKIIIYTVVVAIITAM